MERDLEALYLAEFPAGQKAMAASRQVIEYTINFAIEHSCKSLLDAGSGMSTLFFLEILKKQGCSIISSDDDHDWRFKTIEVIRKITGRDASIAPWDYRSVDIVFYDYGNIESRIFHFKQAMAQAKRYMIIDDVQVHYYREYIREVCTGKELRFLPETLDEYGRMSALLVL